MFTYGPSRNGSLLCTCPYRFTVASGTSFIAICVTTLTRAFGQVEHQAVVAPGIRMGDNAAGRLINELRAHPDPLGLVEQTRKLLPSATIDSERGHPTYQLR